MVPEQCEYTMTATGRKDDLLEFYLTLIGAKGRKVALISDHDTICLTEGEMEPCEGNDGLFAQGYRGKAEIASLLDFCDQKLATGSNITLHDAVMRSNVSVEAMAEFPAGEIAERLRIFPDGKMEYQPAPYLVIYAKHLKEDGIELVYENSDAILSYIDICVDDKEISFDDEKVVADLIELGITKIGGFRQKEDI